MFNEKVGHVNKKLDKIIQDNKSLLDRMAIIERENDKLKHLNAGLQTDIDNMSIKINQLEQGAQRNTLLISRVSETFAERVTDGGNVDNPPQNVREGTINTVFTVIKEACKIIVNSSVIQTAFRLRAKSNLMQPRPLLVTFNSSSVRDSVVKSQRPKETLTFRGSNIYMNDYLTSTNSTIFRKARELVKDGTAFSAWVRDGQIFVKWSQSSRLSRINCMADLTHSS